MWVEVGKLSVLFVLIFLMMRLLGKSLLAQWTPYDLLTIFFLSYVGLSVVEIQGFVHGIISIVVIGALYSVIARLSLVQPLSQLIIGEPTILVKHGKLSVHNLKRSRYSLAELLSSIRTAGYPDIAEIEYVLLEPNGKLSVIPKPEVTPVTLQNLDIPPRYQGMPIAVIVEGRIQHKNLKLIDKDEHWLKEELQQKGCSNIKNVYYAVVSEKEQTLRIESLY
ncbi:Uncharacterized membrane protein YcaP, DUF421 family [Alteribacillus persepolensis]|uniref:Uncharacterized membrane protein YcaP, DUF421 family n=1 Tax=Alteribacillus persepolensis TaxID=568899 RepID=A0A1G8G415_9BACI|nr:DUF421 domain-containing protein [Alteribacillus persepolensis]SDH89134.1 Uncharacterized membrane protein YcaP, DUF421 family [Alteribacillus persepolensis]